jgi:type II secretory pathway pseudopilin PulG
MDNQNNDNINPPIDPSTNPAPTPNPAPVIEQPQPAYTQPQQPVVVGQQVPQQPLPQAVPQAPQQAPQQNPQNDPGRGFGIASLVTAIFGMSLVAIILGIISIEKSKKAGYPTNTLALIGIIWSVVSVILLTMFLAFLVLGNFQGAQSKGRDTETKNDINSVYQKLEEYYNTNVSYPSEFTAETFPGIDTYALTDANGDTFYFGDKNVITLAEAESQSKPTSDQMYQYLPYNCINNNCEGYAIRGYVEKDTVNVYTKYSLGSY